jgi:phage gp29-like protein
LEIHGLPMRLGRYPIGATEQERNTLMQAVVGIGHAAAGILPEGMSIEFQEATTGASDPYSAMIAWAEGAISKSLLGGTLTSTVDGKGSYAAATVHNEVRQDLLESDLRQIAATLTRDLVRPLVALNTALPVAPQWLFAFDQTEDIAVWADAMPKLVSVGVQVPAAWAAQRLGIPAPQNGEAVLSAAPVAAPISTPEPPAGQAGTGAQQAAATAALSAQPATQPAAPPADQPAPPDDAAAQLAAQAAPAIAAWIDRIAALADQAESLEALKGLILAAYGTLPRDQLTQALAAATLTAHLAGRYDVHKTGA